ncbi:MAG: hypothetical protein ACLVEN_13905, partial [Anaerotignum lactatifermentans]
ILPYKNGYLSTVCCDIALIKIIVPAVIPVAFSLYFDIFDGLIQAYVFVFLTALFIKEAIE